MSDLLAKCDWHGDELRVELPQWPEVVTVCVNGKAMAYVPVVNDSKCDACDAMLDCDECLRADASHKELRGLQAENDRLKHELALETFRGAGEIEAYRRETSVAVKKAAQAEAENAKLRVELTDLRLNSCPSCGIKVENEKLLDQLEEQKCFAADLERDVRALRELARDMWRFTGAACKKYPRLFDQFAQGGQMVMLNMLDSFEQRMRELGVEVD